MSLLSSSSSDDGGPLGAGHGGVRGPGKDGSRRAEDRMTSLLLNG